MNGKRLTRETIQHWDLTALEDIIAAFAISVEEALLLHGAEPGKDYNYIDLLKLSQPYAMKYWSEHGKSFTLSNYDPSLKND